MNNNTKVLFPSVLEGEVRVPPSKSMSHRAIICASLSNGESIINNISLSEDIIATINSVKSYGAKVEIGENTLKVKGVKKIRISNSLIDCNESGSTLRFMIPIFSLSNRKITFTGKPSLIKRPQSIYEEIFSKEGNSFTREENNIILEGTLKSGNFIIEGNVSSQFVSGLLFSLPLLEKDSYIKFSSPLESKSYVDLTIQVLEEFGISILEVENGYYIKGNQQYKSKNYEIEGDYSQAAFFLVAGIINGRVRTTGLDHDSLQGDMKIIDIIKQVKGQIIYTENGFITTKSETHGTVVDISDCPDLGPIVALLLSVSKGKSRIVNAKRLRLKESDRIESTVSTLKKLGANIEIDGDDIVIYGRKSLVGANTIDSYNDHRIAMMISIASTISRESITLNRANSINKSYPNFYQDFAQLGGLVEDYEVNEK